MEKVPEHHIFAGFCQNRPKYRDGKKPKAVKVYTINSESKYLIVQNMPDVNVFDEMIKLFELFGPVEEKRILLDYPKVDEFCRAVLIKFQSFRSSRVAKRKMDNFSFMGNVLHVFYSPEYESIDETRQKLSTRRIEVATRLKFLEKEKSSMSAHGKLLVRKYIKLAKKPEKTAKVSDIVQSSSEKRVSIEDLISQRRRRIAEIAEQGKWQNRNNVKNCIEIASSSSAAFNLDSLLRCAEKKDSLPTEKLMCDRKSEPIIINRHYSHPKKRLQLVPRKK